MAGVEAVVVGGRIGKVGVEGWRSFGCGFSVKGVYSIFALL